MHPRNSRMYFSLFGACACVLLLAGGVASALHSSVFFIRALDVQGGTKSPLTDSEISSLVGIEIGKDNLFLVDLEAVEARLKRSPWVREVNLQKQFPGTLRIQLGFRQAVALFQGRGGQLYYVDNDGEVFSKVGFEIDSSLPLLQGFLGAPEGRLRQGIDVIKEASRLPLVSVESISWKSDQGFRVLFKGTPDSRKFAVFLGDLPSEEPSEQTAQMTRIGQVLRYAYSHQIPLRQIRADAGKKIVVKTARGS